MNADNTTHSPNQQQIRRVEYIPPNPTAIKEYACAVCADLGKQDAAFHQPEVMSGFATFLTFVADRLAKYLSDGHEDFLLETYRKRKQESVGDQYVTPKTNS
jgi:hypothetical protein